MDEVNQTIKTESSSFEEIIDPEYAPTEKEALLRRKMLLEQRMCQISRELEKIAEQLMLLE